MYQEMMIRFIKKWSSDLEPEPTASKAITTEKVAVPKTSKKRGPRGPYKKKT